MGTVSTQDPVHDIAVRRLLTSFRQLPVGAPVRLRKSTSNLFRPRSPADGRGLDVSGLDGVLNVDVRSRTADVQGMCTYERLVEATLEHGLMPLVVPQLRTITLGGAVTGLGIESTSFRHGLPHESVLEMDILTGAAELVTARQAGEHSDLFAAFPNSYGSLGYATRLRIELMPVQPYVALRHVQFAQVDELESAIEEISATRIYDGQSVDFCDGIVFGPKQAYLTLGRWTQSASDPSDYTGQHIYYRSIADRATDVLTVHDYLWRWDTDWFWCSRVFGAQNPYVRRLWPRRYRRSDVYHRLVALENRFGIKSWLGHRRGKPREERVIQDVEVPVARLSEFLTWFDRNVGMRPVWLCPLRLRERDGQGSARTWPLYPLEAGVTYVNVGFWGAVGIAPGRQDGDLNRAIETEVTRLGGHKSLYSDAYYSRDEFDRLYNGAGWTQVKQRYDPGDRLVSLYDKAVNRR